MSCFSTVSAATANSELDLTKHVRYTAGMILGVDDFTQEFAYLSGRDRWLARDALGYGTISGLSIKIEEDTGKHDIRVMVNPGVAVSPRGQFICVPSPQCAYLNEWLAAADVDEMHKYVRHGQTSPPTSPPEGDELTLYIVLCYRDCPTDNVPIPGEPCRNEDELTAASRVKDDFSLELRFEAPSHAEEKAVRKFVEWLKQITITDSGASTPIDQFSEVILDEWIPKSPPVTPAPPTGLQINADDFCDYMRTAFRLWVTELRNVLSDRETGCAVEMTGAKKLEDCVLLAELHIPLASGSPNWTVSETEDVEKIEENRPFLLHLRMLQEWMLCGCQCRSETTAPVVSPLIPLSPPPTSPIVTSPVTSPVVVNSPEVITSPHLPPPHAHSLDSLTDVTAGSPSEGQILVFRDTEWVAEDQTIVTPEPIALDDLTDVTVSAPNEGQILIFRSGEWVAEDPAIVPPVPIALDNLTDVAVPSPTAGQYLVFRGGQWIAETQAPIKHSTLTDLLEDDHTIYLLADGTRPLGGNLQGGKNKIVDLALGTAPGDAVVFQQAIKDGDPAGGDLTGTYPKPTIDMLQGNPVKAESPNKDDRLTWDGTAWVPQPIIIQDPTPTAVKELILPLATITRIGNATYEIWFNIDAPGNLARVVGFKESHLQILDETDSPTRFTAPIRHALKPGVRNVFTSTLNLEANQIEPDRMRFNFDVNEIVVEFNSNNPADTAPLIEYARKNDIKFPGYLEGRFATVFVRGLVRLG